MARRLRVEYYGAVYHAMADGNHGQPLFKDDKDGLKEADLKELPLGCPEKVALAWWLRKHTAVSLRWAADRLKMGHYSRVSQAIARAGCKPGKGSGLRKLA